MTAWGAGAQVPLLLRLGLMVNNPPDALDDVATVAEDSASTVINVLQNDTTAPDTGETLTVTAVTQPNGGSVTLNGGVVRFTPTTNFNGGTTFTYTVTDGNGGTDTASVSVTVTAVNDAPSASDDAFSVAKDSGATTLDVLANDSSSPDTGETLTVTSVTQPSSGSVTLPSGVVRFTPTTGFTGITTFTYTSSDGNGGTATATVTVTVTGSGSSGGSNPPTANNDAFTVTEDSGATTLNVLANDTTAPDTGETLTVIAVTQPNGGSVMLSGGVVRFTPSADFTGGTTFNYTVSDGNSGTAMASVNVTVTAVNDPPTATDDTIMVGKDSGATTLNVLANDSPAPDTGETLTVIAVTQPSNGGAVTLTGGVVRFTPTAGFTGTVTFTYTISDGNGGSATASVWVTVTERPPSGENNPPKANNDSFSLTRNSGPTTLDVLANDSAAPDTGETLTVIAVTQPSSGGTVTLTGGMVRFTPTTGFTGTVTFTYTISDGQGGTATATVIVTLSPDTDGDGLSEDLEQASGTDPNDDDTDDDGLMDGTEDTNRNGKVDPSETDPIKFDSDGDELGDGLELGRQIPQGEDTSEIFKPDLDPTTTTAARVADTDGDALSDGREDANHDGRVDSNETDPNNSDTDGGGVEDGIERDRGRNPLDEMDDYAIVGNGCASTGATHLAPLLLFCLPLLLRRWKPIDPCLASRAKFGWMPIILGMLMAPTDARSAPSSQSEQIDVQQYKPGPGAYDLLALHSPQVNGHLGWNLGLFVSYAKNPLTVLDPGTNQIVYKLVEHQITVDVIGAVSLFERFEFGLAVPITSLASQRESAAAPLFGIVNTTGVGDLRWVIKAQLLSRGHWHLAAALPLHLPIGDGGPFLSGGFSAHPKLLGEWVGSGGLRVLANMGINLRSQQQLRSLIVANELAYSLGGEVPFKVGKHGLSVGGSLMGAQRLKGNGAEGHPLELLGTVRYWLSEELTVHFGGGPGLTWGYGTPRFRLLAGAAWVLPVHTGP
jgi:hypothetical protein